MKSAGHGMRFTCAQCGSHFRRLDCACHSPQLCEIQLHFFLCFKKKVPLKNTSYDAVERFD